ncbi:HXXEE domain-containing protein [Bradyrhizobium sp. HKCCYLS20291]|uniref:HXXEE domain-containing protein n=1 Tax=Bradyrhizobium sp. HKCCYLS20291 TaxID=3420766 RepID=UPI003EB93D49
MSFIALAWMFAAAITVHNAEEAIWLPAWSRDAGKWHIPVGPRPFRFALFVLTIMAAGAVSLAALQGKQSLGAYALCGYALAMLVNVAIPHVLATVALGRYAPGTGTALLLNLPVTSMLLRAALVEGYIDGATFTWVGPLVALGIAASVPVLFRLGQALFGGRSEAAGDKHDALN